MNSVPLVPLSELIAASLGAVNPAKTPDEVFDLYSIPAFDRGRPDVLPGRAIGSTKQIVRPGDVLLSKIVPHIRRSWVVGQAQGRRLIASGEWIVFRSERIHPDYLKHVLIGDAFRVQFMRTVAGVGGSLLRARPPQVAKIAIPLPGLSEQRRIADMLDRVGAALVKRRAALAQIEEFCRALYLDLVGDPATNPRAWPVLPLGKVTQCLDRDRKPVKEELRLHGAVPYYGANGQQGWIDHALFDEPLVLVAEDGGYFETPERGVAYRIDGPSWVNNHAHVLRPFADKVDIEFLHRALRHYDFRPYISGTTRSKLTQAQMSAAPIIVPPLERQHDFAHQMSVANALIRAQHASLADMGRLFASLQYVALGEGLWSSRDDPYKADAMA